MSMELLEGGKYEEKISLEKCVVEIASLCEATSKEDRVKSLNDRDNMSCSFPLEHGKGFLPQLKFSKQHILLEMGRTHTGRVKCYRSMNQVVKQGIGE